jgi:hypothetical protein
MHRTGLRFGVRIASAQINYGATSFLREKLNLITYTLSTTICLITCEELSSFEQDIVVYVEDLW